MTSGALWLAACAAQEATERDEPPSWESYLAAATGEFEGRTFYRVEGDLPVSLTELRARYDRLYGTDLAAVGQHSTVNVVNGADDIWNNIARRDLNYCVSDEFGALKARTVAEMAHAAAEWESHGNFHFRYVSSEDHACNNSNPAVLFSVRPWTQGGACAFFPSGGGCVPRTLVINYSSYTSGLKTSQGVFRHELGHVLGLRHEHIRVANGCSEDGDRRAVTAYDSNSVMHYHQCAGSTNTGDYVITPSDAAGVASLYGPRHPGILWRETSGQVAVWFMDGATIAATTFPGTADPVQWKIEGTGDFNADGETDILWRHVAGQTAIWSLFNGALIGQSAPGGTAPGWKIQATGDFDADGASDILWRQDDGQLAIWPRGDIAGAVYPSWSNASGPVDLAWQVQGVADFNGDAHADILWRHTNGQIAIWFMDGGTFIGESAPGTTDPTGVWKIEKLGDLNGDHRADILLRNTAGRLEVWFSGQAGISSPSYKNQGGPSDLTWKIEAIGDFNHDRRDDILWRQANGQLAIWFMNGATFVGEAYPALIDNSWKINGLL